ncbi:lysophospholipid acyltransferase family protein [Ruficoccus amylovorans]|uniref:Lysophospholipid acyltransferase family protein n=1 Tax=Ruficoccus amylovorans TaxID=1804625 RepID=A0A842HGF9_9BACT|nr:lysophospholipid acyltransferase family protein [Ruficoccus amylovorans]MBC2594716.1 lysophospholipid acyltransferase family protein [Ruficoccus amylovorans]
MNARTLANQENKERREVQRVSGWERLALGLGCLLLKLWLRSLRMRADEHTRKVLGNRKSGVEMLWHNQLFMTPEMARRYMFYPGRRIHALISGSKDGAWLAGVFEAVNVVPIRGSSSWRGTEALREIVRILKDGEDVGITPDGPRGPCYSVQKGALMAAKMARTPVTLIAMNPSRAWRLKSWDRFYIPVPFTRVEVKAVGFSDYEALVKEANAEEPAAYVRRRLLELSGIPDWKPES